MELNNIDISKLPADVRRKFKQLQVMHAEKKVQNKAKEDFMSFVKCVWPDFIEGSHHRHIAKKFNQLATGEITRLIVINHEDCGAVKIAEGKNNFKEEQIHKSSFLKLKKIVTKKFPKLKLEFHIMKLS